MAVFTETHTTARIVAQFVAEYWESIAAQDTLKNKFNGFAIYRPHKLSSADRKMGGFK